MTIRLQWAGLTECLARDSTEASERRRTLRPSSVPGIDSQRLGVSRDDPYLREISQTAAAESRSAELLLVPGTSHATALFSDHRGMPERIAVWLASHLR